MKLKETRILDAEGARYACIANQYCTRADCEEYDAILNDAAESSRKPGGITVDDLARIAANVPMLANELPPCASFSFVEVFDKAQRDVYKYLRRKYDTETDWYSGIEYPAGAGLPNENELVFYFPEDRVTAALTKYGCNRCLHGYIPTKSNR